VNGWDCADGDNNTNPTNYAMDHGTHTSGCAAAVNNNGIGASSIGWNLKIIPVKCAKNTDPTTSVGYGYQGIIYAAKCKARVISCSWGGTGAPSAAAQSIIDYAWNKGCIVIVSAGNDNNNVKATNTVTFTVGAAALTISADNKTRVYGAANPTLTYTPSGFVNGENSGVLSGSPSLTTSATTNSSVAGSSYTITAAVGTLSAANYSFTFVNGQLSVTAAPLSITANNDSKTYGQTKTYGAGQTTFTSSGLQNGETIGSVTITASGGTATNANVGSYNLTPSAATGGTFSAGNYNITYNNGTLTVNKANVTLALSSTANPSTNAASLSFNATATAEGSVTPTGTVQLLTNGVAWGSPASLVSGSAQIAAPTPLPHGYTSVSAQFTGGATFNSTNSTAINQLVNKAPTGTSKTLGTTQNQSATVTLSKWLNRQDLDADGDVLTIASYNQTTTQGGTVSVAGGGMTYTPATNFFGSDSFTYTVTDGYTNLTLTVNVNIVSADAPSGNIIGFTAPNFQVATGSKIKFLGVPGTQRYVQYRSVNGGNWVTFSTNTMPACGCLEVEDHGSLGDLNGRTYRTSTRP